MSDNLPVLHPSEYVDPLEADSRQSAIGTVKSGNILMAIGDGSEEGEWIRMDLGGFIWPGEWQTRR